jgi:aryl-alcohol dehydrogenase-like predicted oxidoreductase
VKKNKINIIVKSPRIFDPMSYIPDYIQPLGIKATCHMHDKPLGFKSIDDLQKHWVEEHVNKQLKN